VLGTTPTLKSDDRTSWIPVRVAAKQLQVTVCRVYQLIRDGQVLARKVDRTWLVSQRSVEARITLLRSEDQVIQMRIVERPKGMGV